MKRGDLLTVLVVAFLLGGAATVVLAACANDSAEPQAVQFDEDCDAEDYAHREPECGYADAAGVWVWYPWIAPVYGGRPAAGQHPRPPAGARITPLKPGPVPKPAPAPKVNGPAPKPAAPGPAPKPAAPPPVRVNPPAVRVGK